MSANGKLKPGSAPELTQAEKELLNGAGLQVVMARERMGQAQRELAEAEGSAKGVLRAVLKLKGLNPDAWVYSSSADGRAELVSVAGMTGPASLGTNSPTVRAPQFGQVGGKPSI